MKHLKLLLVMIGVLALANAPAAASEYDLHQAVIDNDLPLVKRLLSKGKAIDVIGSRKYGYGSALHLAVREGHVDIAQVLIDRGAEVDVLDPDDFTPLHNAAWNGNLEMTKLLLDAGADIEASTYDGDTPLKLAQNNDQAQVAEFIQAKLQSPATDPDAFDISGTYVVTKLTGGKIFVLRPLSKDIREVTIVQNGNQITATYDDGRGKIWGDIEGDTVKFDWVAHDATSGFGKWTFKPGSNELIGDISLGFGVGAGTTGITKKYILNLTKIETDAAPIPDISGTYTSEITHKDFFANMTNKDYFGARPKIEVKIEQNGNAITGTISGDRSGEIKGVLAGNRITFKFNFTGGSWGGMWGEGVWVVSDHPVILIGTWKTSNKAHTANGIWNLTKVESEAIDVTGTYIAETTGSLVVGTAAHPASVVKKVKKINGQLIVLKQTGNTITGSVSSQSVPINGTREGNVIKFYIVGSQQINGTWEINADGTEMVGKWDADGGYAPSGKWNLKRVK